MYEPTVKNRQVLNQIRVIAASSTYEHQHSALRKPFTLPRQSQASSDCVRCPPHQQSACQTSDCAAPASACFGLRSGPPCPGWPARHASQLPLRRPGAAGRPATTITVVTSIRTVGHHAGHAVIAPLFAPNPSPCLRRDWAGSLVAEANFEVPCGNNAPP